VGLGVSCASATPVPESWTFVGVVAALLVTAAVALKTPGAFGVNLMLIAVVSPGATVSGRLSAVTAKYLLEIATLLMVSEAAPEFVALKVAVLLPPTATLPKLTIPVPKDKPVVVCELDEPTELIPWHPTRKIRANKIRANNTRAVAGVRRLIAEFRLDGGRRIVILGNLVPKAALLNRCRGTAHHESGLPEET